MYTYNADGDRVKEVIKYADSDGTSYTTTYTYDGFGNVLTTESDDGGNSVASYDEKGYCTKKEAAYTVSVVNPETGEPTDETEEELTVAEYVYEFDDEGRAISCTVTKTQSSPSTEDGSYPGNTVTFEYDENGNVSRKTETSENGSKTVIEYEWKQIETPSKGAWLASKTALADARSAGDVYGIY